MSAKVEAPLPGFALQAGVELGKQLGTSIFRLADAVEGVADGFEAQVAMQEFCVRMRAGGRSPEQVAKDVISELRVFVRVWNEQPDREEPS